MSYLKRKEKSGERRGERQMKILMDIVENKDEKVKKQKINDRPKDQSERMRKILRGKAVKSNNWMFVSNSPTLAPFISLS